MVLYLNIYCTAIFLYIRIQLKCTFKVFLYDTTTQWHAKLEYLYVSSRKIMGCRYNKWGDCIKNTKVFNKLGIGICTNSPPTRRGLNGSIRMRSDLSGCCIFNDNLMYLCTWFKTVIWNNPESLVSTRSWWPYAHIWVCCTFTSAVIEISFGIFTKYTRPKP